MIASLAVLIETLWNVKKQRTARGREDVRVLIETLWNVKILQMDFYCFSCYVLIETLWNVKSQKLSAVRQSLRRINRNIVECKGS